MLLSCNSFLSMNIFVNIYNLCFPENKMSKLYSLDTSLIHNIKLSLEDYSERILLSGLQIRPETKKTWLNNLKNLPQKLPTKSLCIGQSPVRTFDHLQCNYDLSSKGFISLETKLTLEASMVCFSIDPTMSLSTEQSPWSDNFIFKPYFIELCPLTYREVKEMTPVLKHFQPDNLMATLMDLIIRDCHDTAFDPIREPNNDNVKFVSHLKKNKFRNNSPKDNYGFDKKHFEEDNYNHSSSFYGHNRTSYYSGGNNFYDDGVRQSDKASSALRGFSFGASGSNKRSISPSYSNKYNRDTRGTGVIMYIFKLVHFFVYLGAVSRHRPSKKIHYAATREITDTLRDLNVRSSKKPSTPPTGSPPHGGSPAKPPGPPNPAILGAHALMGAHALSPTTTTTKTVTWPLPSQTSSISSPHTNNPTTPLNSHMTDLISLAQPNTTNSPPFTGFNSLTSTPALHLRPVLPLVDKDNTTMSSLNDSNMDRTQRINLESHLATLQDKLHKQETTIDTLTGITDSQNDKIAATEYQIGFMSALLANKFINNIDIVKNTLNSFNIHLAFPTLYAKLREISVSQHSLTQSYMQYIENSLLTQLNAKDQNTLDQSISDTLRLRLHYLKWNTFMKPLICHSHQFGFDSVSAYKIHFKKPGHLDEQCTIYKQFLNFTLSAKTASLTVDDLQYISTLSTDDIKREAYKNITHLRNILPIISLLNLETPPRNHRISMHTALKTLCAKSAAHTEEEVPELVTYFKTLQVIISNKINSFKQLLKANLFYIPFWSQSFITVKVNRLL